MAEDAVKGMLSIVIPSYNEPMLAKVVRDVHAEMVRVGRAFEIIVVDDGSTSGSAGEITPEEGVVVVRHRINRGYGASLKDGILRARGEYVLTMDADGQHRPSDIRRFLEAMDDGADAALGSRQKLLHSTLWRMPGKWFLQRVANYLIQQNIRDLNCGFRVFRTELIRRFQHLCPNAFSFSLTSTLIFLSQGYDVIFVPLDVEQRVGKSAVRVSDGFATFLNIFRIIMLFNPMRILMPPMAFCLVLGTASLIYDLISTNIKDATILLLVSGFLFFFFGLLADQVAAIRKEIT
ncbi:MAG: glycosyltransferase family 2 protein [Phycisphaerae bacterium]|nr:glycosyltransferase family 2 protein [Phycisphaerae bacterium]